MELMILLLTGILMHKLGKKGKAYREEKRRAKFGATVQQAREEAYRKELQQQGIDDDLITIILPTVMNK